MINWPELKFPSINRYSVGPSTYMTETQPKVTTMVNDKDLERLISDFTSGTTPYYSIDKEAVVGCLEELQHYRGEDKSADVPVIRPKTALDVQVGGEHYKTAIQPVQYIHANNIGFCEGNVIKYVSRWRKKNGLADLEKAKHYLELLIQLETEGDNNGKS